MLLSGAPLSVRERLEAAGSGLRELQLLRRRQEELVRAALQLRREEEEQEQEEKQEERLNCEEKLLQENIMLLRKQLNCLRRRDFGLISQLQELDRQISDLRLDTEASHDQLEMDSRPSSGFYELSDAASGSLSNSSNSVFSECFCSTTDADTRTPSADEPPSCLDCDRLVGELCDDTSFCGSVRRSLSAPQPPSMDSSEPQSKFLCDLVALNSGEVYRYPSPLHAVAVHSPVFLQKSGPGGQGRDDDALKGFEVVEELKAEPFPVSAPPVPQSSSWPAPTSSLTPSQKHLDSYIFSLLQRRALPIRTSRPRTSISADPAKSVLRQASFCVRPASGSGSGFLTLKPPESRPSWPAAGAEGAVSSSPHRQVSVENKPDEQEKPGLSPEGRTETMKSGSMFPSREVNSPPGNMVQTITDSYMNSLLKQRSKCPPPSAAPAKDFRDMSSPITSSSKEIKPPCFPPDPEQLLKSLHSVKTSGASLLSPNLLQTGRPDTGPEMNGVRSSSQGQDGAVLHTVNTKNFAELQQNSKKVKAVKAKTSTKMRTGPPSEHKERRQDKSHHISGCRKSGLLEDNGSARLRASRRAGSHGSSSRIRRFPASIPEGRVLDKQDAPSLSSVRSGSSRHHQHGHHHHGNRHYHGHHHQHGRDQVIVVAKPKYKRNDYRHLRAITEVAQDEGLRRAQRRHRKELLTQSAGGRFLPSNSLTSSPYAYAAGSDSEYSAECASLFHSTIVDTSEDERSNYTANRFGDSESSGDEYVEESTATSDTEESGGGVAGGSGSDRGWSQLAAAGQEVSPAQAKAFIKIKASHNLKKKILRFRSGSLKLMTTV